MKIRKVRKEDVKEVYSKLGIKEWNRLAKDPFHKLEFDTTIHFLKEYLPKKGLVLDAGSGPGRYAIELAKKGYTVVLFDFTPKLLKIARKKIKKQGIQKKVKGIIEGSIVDLSRFKSNSFDAVLCLGAPLNHILNRKQRNKAIDELIRVAKTKAPIFISVINRVHVIQNALSLFPHEMTIKGLFDKYRDNGDYLGGYGFAPSHFFLPEEFRALFEKRKDKIRIIEMIGLEGLSSCHRKATNKLFKTNPKAWKVWKETHLKLCNHPSVIGISEHIMIILKKK